jgi:hypothetical protein
VTYRLLVRLYRWYTSGEWYHALIRAAATFYGAAFTVDLFVRQTIFVPLLLLPVAIAVLLLPETPTLLKVGDVLGYVELSRAQEQVRRAVGLLVDVKEWGEVVADRLLNY